MPLTKAQQKLATAAEEAFNRTYASQYGDRWETSLRPALALPTRYAVLVNRYAGSELDIELVFSDEERKDLGRLPFLQSRNQGTQDSQLPLLAYERRISESAEGEGHEVDSEVAFPPPRVLPGPESSKLQTHWNLDAASLLPVCVLDVHPGDKVLDLCAAPGGKSVALAQLLHPKDSAIRTDGPRLQGGCLHSNESDHVRNKRLAANLQAYLGEALFKSGEVKVSKLDGSAPNAVFLLPLGLAGYDRVLVDAPCSSERHVLHAHLKAKKAGRIAEEMASWRSGHSKKMAKTQAALLLNALKAVKVGGRVVYATCSLSDEENDGVVDKGLELVQKERKKGLIRWDIVVRSTSLKEIKMEKWAEATRQGWIVLPDHPGGGRWGPLYFAVLEKVDKR